jgi:hypothetical protein
VQLPVCAKIFEAAATAANGTVATLINIVERLGEDEKKGSKLQALIEELNGDE